MDLATHLHLALSAPPNGDKHVLLRLLELRQQLAKASTAKFQAFLDRLQDDDYIRDLLMYHGAGTGRWTAKGPQLQNLPSRDLELEAEQVPTAIRAAIAGLLDDLYEHPLAAASSCIRGCLTASPGHRFLCADFSAIEGRVLAWMAGEQHVLDAYIRGQRLYCVAASGIFGRPYDEIYNGRKHEPYKGMDATGKVTELACGYQGALGAFRKMERSQKLNLGMSDKTIKGHITAWRESRPATVRLWKALETACLDAVRSPGTLTSYRDIRFKVVGKFLMMRLPSNRLLYYFDPSIEEKMMPWQNEDGTAVYKECVRFWGVDSKTKKWSTQWIYGGLLAENAVQAASRDVMVEAMLRHDAAGYTPVMTCHDELLADVPLGRGELDEFVRIMTVVPPWAAGLPIAAEGWEGPIYRK